MEVKRKSIKEIDTKDINHEHRHNKDFKVTHLNENSILGTSEVSENIVNVVNSESANDKSKVLVTDVTHEISTVKENADTSYEVKVEVKDATSDNIDVKINVTMNKLSEVDETTNPEAKYASYGNQEATINETKNESTVKVYDAKEDTKFLIESTVDVKFGLLFNELKYNTRADFNNEYNINSSSTLFSENLSQSFGVGRSYMINNSTFYDDKSLCDDKKYVEVGVYATKVQAAPNDDSITSQEDQTMFEYETSSDEDTDEEDVTPLTFELKKYSEGYLINNKVYLTEFQWNTMLYNSNNDTIYCALCDKLITMPDMCDNHMISFRHKFNLNKHKPLNKFPDSFIRLIRKQYHCGFCNKLFNKEDKDDHLSSRVHNITTEFARKKVMDKIKIKKVHKIGKYTFNMEENETAEVESDDSWDVYFDEERKCQSDCNDSITTVSDEDNRTTVNDSVNCDASAKDDSVNVAMGADIDTVGRDTVVASGCGESDSGHGITISGNDIVSNSSDVESNDNDFAHSGDDNVAISKTGVTNGTSDVPKSSSKGASSDNDVAIRDNDIADSGNDDVSINTDIVNSDNVVVVNSNDHRIASSYIKKSGESHDIASNDTAAVADKSSDKAVDDTSIDKNVTNQSRDKSNNVQTVEQTVVSEEHKLCEIKPNRKFVVTKPKNFVQDFLMIEYKDKKIGLHFQSWHMLIKNSMGSLYCAICKLVLPPKEINSHCEETKHLKKLMCIRVMEEFSEYFVRRIDSNFYHCSHCNSMIAQYVMKSHLLTEHSKSGTKHIEDEQKNYDTIKNAGKIDGQQNTDVHDNNQEVKGLVGKRKKKTSTPLENNSQTDNIYGQNQPIYNVGGHYQPNYNVGGYNQTHYNMSDPNHRASNPNYGQAWSPGLHYEQMIGDIMVFKFGFLFQLKYLAYNVVCRTLDAYFCGLCNLTVADEVALFSHMTSPYHGYCMERTPYVVEFGLHLIRHIRDVFHCTVCNVPVNTYAIFNHTTSELHAAQLAAALGVPAERTMPPAVLSPFILPTGAPSRPLLPIPRVSFAHLNGVIDPTRIQDPCPASHAKSAGAAADLGPCFTDQQTPVMQPNFERNSYAFDPAQSDNVEANIAAVQNNLPPNASMPRSQADKDHLAKILLDAHRNCEPAHNETQSQQSFTMNDPLAQFKKDDGLENPSQGPVCYGSQDANETKCENLDQDIIMNYTQDSAVGQNTVLTKNSLISNETTPQINSEVAHHNAISFEDFDIQNVNDTIAYEKLGLDLLDHSKNCDIAQDSKSGESNLTLDYTTPEKNIKTDAQEMSGSKSYKPYNINDAIAIENLALNLLDQIKISNVTQCVTSEQNNSTLSEKTSPKNIEVGVQNALDSDRHELHGILNDCENLAVNLSDRLKNCDITQNHTLVQDDVSTLIGMTPEKNFKHDIQNTLNSNNYELHKINDTPIAKDLIINETTPEMSVKVGAQNTMFFHNVELHNIKGADASEKLCRELLYLIRKYNIENQDSKQAQRSLTSNKTTPEKNLEIGGQEATSSDSYKLDINDKVVHENLTLTHSSETNKCNVAQDSTSPEKKIEFGAQSTFKTKFNESQNAKAKALESVSRRLLNVIKNDLEINRLRLKARSLMNIEVDAQDTLDFEDYLIQNKNGIIAMGLTLLAKNLTLDEIKPGRVTSEVNYQRDRDGDKVPYERLCCDDSDEQLDTEDLNSGNDEYQLLLSDFGSITSMSSEEKLHKSVNDAVICNVSEIETEQRNQPLIKDVIIPTRNISSVSQTSHCEEPECKDSDESVIEPLENAASEDRIETVNNKTDVDLAADCDTKNEATN